jgi:preprotein translocase subunit SecE
MSLGKRALRGGPAGAGRSPEGGRLVTPSPAKPQQSERMRQMMTPSRPGSARLLQERLNLTFFQEAVAELRKVHWPTRDQLRNLVLLVIGVSLAVGIILGAMDFVFEKLFETVLRIGA